MAGRAQNPLHVLSVRCGSDAWRFLVWYQVQGRFMVDIKTLPEQIDTTTYSKDDVEHKNGSCL